MVVNWINPPPATPCNALPTIKTCILGAVAQTIELTKNHATAASNNGLRPQMSDSFAHIIDAAALARRYAPPTQV